jgi:hypothetical protein
LLIVRALPGHPVLLRQPRLVATAEFRGDGEYVGVSRMVGLVMNVIRLEKVSKINYLFSKMTDYGR